MKKLLTALILSTLVLSACGAFRSGHAWKKAKQENPLQVPPEMDRPSTTAALTIPPPNEAASTTPSTPAASTPAAAPVHGSAVNATRMHLPDDVDTAYKRVGLALQQGGAGAVTAQDPAQHTYQLSVASKPALGTSKSFLQKHFSNIQQQDDSGSKSESGPGGGSTVTLKVTPDQNGGSTVSASGDPQQAVNIISVLSGRLGG